MKNNFDLSPADIFGGPLQVTQIVSKSGNRTGVWIFLLGGITVTVGIIAYKQYQMRKKLEAQLISSINGERKT